MGPGTHCFPYQWVQLQTYESQTLFFMEILQYHCILGLAEIKILHPREKIDSKMQDAQVKKITECIVMPISKICTLYVLLKTTSEPLVQI